MRSKGEWDINCTSVGSRQDEIRPTTAFPPLLTVSGESLKGLRGNLRYVGCLVIHPSHLYYYSFEVRGKRLVGVRAETSASGGRLHT